MAERIKFNTSVSFIIQNNDKILLFYRTDGYFKDGWWVLPAGHVEENETATETVIRECKEELGIDVLTEDIKFSHIVFNLSGENKRMDFYFNVQKFSGELGNMEPTKCEKMTFFDISASLSLPNIAPTTLQALKNIKNKNFYSERK